MCRHVFVIHVPNRRHHGFISTIPTEKANPFYFNAVQSTGQWRRFLHSGQQYFPTQRNVNPQLDVQENLCGQRPGLQN